MRLFAEKFAHVDLQQFDIKADYDDGVPVPRTKGKPVPAKYRQYLQYFPMWATTPDFHRVSIPPPLPDWLEPNMKLATADSMTHQQTLHETGTPIPSVLKALVGQTAHHQLQLQPPILIYYYAHDHAPCSK